MLGDFSENFFFLLVKHIGEYLQANAFFARCLTNGINEFTHTRLIKYPLLLEHNLGLMARVLKIELDRECLKLKCWDIGNRLQQGYENCWKECCSQARELLYLELLSISVSKGVSSHLLSIDSLGAEPLDIGVSPLKAGQPLEVLDVSSQTP